jgi:hypothetical protein
MVLSNIHFSGFADFEYPIHDWLVVEVAGGITVGYRSCLAAVLQPFE